MKKLLPLSLIGVLFSINLSANNNLDSLKKIPLNVDYLSVENGGNKSAIESYSDGIGIYVAGLEGKKFPAMNELVFKHGEEAKKAGETLKDYVLDKGNNKEKELAALLGTNTGGSVIGGVCDDGDPNTSNDIYIDTNGTCIGTPIVVRNSIKCENDPIGSEIIVDGISYLVVDDDTIRNNLDRAETLCTSKVTDMSHLFSNWSGYGSFNGDLSGWDVSNVTNMEGMFGGSNFNGDLSGWDVSNVTNMYGMFSGSKFNNNSLKDWDVSNQYGFYGMFSDSEFNGDLSGWDVSNIINMESMFMNSKFNNNSLNNWNVSNLLNANAMFEGSDFNQNISNWNTINLLYYNSFGSDFLDINNYPNFIN